MNRSSQHLTWRRSEESVIVLYESDVSRHAGQSRAIEEVALARSALVAWRYTRRLLALLRCVPQVEYEEAYYRSRTPHLIPVGLNQTRLRRPRGGSTDFTSWFRWTILVPCAQRTIV